MKLHHESFEKGSCGFGLLVNLSSPTHTLVQDSLGALKRILHRGAVAPDGLSGDGCGISISFPHDFFKNICDSLGIYYNPKIVVGQLFLNRDNKVRKQQIDLIETIAKKNNYTLSAQREVPINTKVCGKSALETIPSIYQLFFSPIKETDKQQEVTDLFIIRKRVETKLRNDKDFYICSLSSTMVCYKALVMPDKLEEFFLDLKSDLLKASVCLIHQRFATNTFPRWRLAQPFRYLVHNGEINTISGNRLWYKARIPKFLTGRLSPLSRSELLLDEKESDSASLDEIISLMTAGGMDIITSLRIAIPPSWSNQPSMPSKIKAFYEYFSRFMEPWDGPASIAFSDGRYGGCILDRNGLRPARWVLTKDQTLVVASEVGVCDFKPENVIKRGRLSPGEMIVADINEKKIFTEGELFDFIEKGRPFISWIKNNTININPDGGKVFEYEPMTKNSDEFLTILKLFNVSTEEIQSIIKPLAVGKNEAIGSMGDDVPLPILSKLNRSIFDCFRQQFAQVTNPPIDSLRENLVMSLESCLGPEHAFFDMNENQAKKAIIRTPLLSPQRFSAISTLKQFNPKMISLNFDLNTPLKEAIEKIKALAVDSVKSGSRLILLTDCNCKKSQYPVNALMATGAIHHALLQEDLRADCSLIIDTSVVRDSHQLAVLIGYGATAVFPRLAYEVIFHTFAEKNKSLFSQLAHSYRKAINKGLLKILSKMGISTIASYRGAQLFEIIGLDKEVTDACFRYTPSRIAGAGFDDLYQDLVDLNKTAFNKNTPLSVGGYLKYVDDGEYHAFNPDVVRSLQQACRTGNYDEYEIYSNLVNNRPPTTLRDLLALNKEINKPIPLSEVESVEEILKRFDSAGMSLGALSPEAHITLAKAMNAIGGRSNSGEGGEDSSRYNTNLESKIKQVASGRFGVTPYYLRNAEVLQIKIAQGAKPGEGGQLPGDKVNVMIAKLRHSMPGVSLISPPPHHDIYSIEDLAQLIFDLKQINPHCLVSVKLVSEAGVGTIAAGVAKAYADLITIAGYDGGTGASPLSSIKYAGSPWELGLPETHHLLVANNLRHKVRLQVDGGLKTGLDIVKGAILGAESFGFGTAPMIAMGCKYLRICHLNNCATGIATQHNVLRKMHFHGQTQMVINFFQFIAQEARSILASLGVPKITDLIGRTELLKQIDGVTGKHKKVDLSAVIEKGENKYFAGIDNEPFDKGVLATKMVEDSIDFIKSCKNTECQQKTLEYEIKNFNRSIGAKISGEITELYGNKGLSNNALHFSFKGTAGQSFGVWNAIGMNLTIEGDANDYVGKGMCGGTISLKPPSDAPYKSSDAVIAGNTCLYGATGGKFFASGIVGERFAVRNSGAIAIVEGSGNHCCEYMTGGVVVVLGDTGINFAAGMTGGIAYCYDEKNLFVDRYNNELVNIKRINTENMSDYQMLLLNLMEEHADKTGSRYCQELLDNFDDSVNKFWLITPKASDLQDLLNSLQLAA